PPGHDACRCRLELPGVLRERAPPRGPVVGVSDDPAGADGRRRRDSLAGELLPDRPRRDRRVLRLESHGSGPPRFPCPRAVRLADIPGRFLVILSATKDLPSGFARSRPFVAS